MANPQQQQEALVGPLDPNQAIQQLAGGAMSLAVASVGCAEFCQHRAVAYQAACTLASKALDAAVAAAGAGPVGQLEGVVSELSAVAALLAETTLNSQGGAADGN